MFTLDHHLLALEALLVPSLESRLYEDILSHSPDSVPAESIREYLLDSLPDIFSTTSKGIYRTLVFFIGLGKVAFIDQSTVNYMWVECVKSIWFSSY